MDKWPKDAQLDLGAGAHKKPGYVGVDSVEFDGIDFIWDLRKFPYPADDNSINAIYTHHTLEHFDWEVVVKLMNECNRILKKGHSMEIVVPLFPSQAAIDDPAHKTFFGKETFGRFEPENEYAYEMDIVNKWRRTLNNWTPEIQVSETSDGMNWLFPARRELHCVLEKLA